MRVLIGRLCGFTKDLGIFDMHHCFAAIHGFLLLISIMRYKSTIVYETSLHDGSGIEKNQTVKSILRAKLERAASFGPIAFKASG